MAVAGAVNKKIEIPSEIRYIKKVSKDILNALRRFKVEESLQFDIRLCVEEAVRNAIEHGNVYNKKLPIHIFYSVSKDKFEVEIEDRGKGFDVKKVPDPTDQNNILKEGGRGVYLIHKLMDSVEYNDKGNRVRLVKFFKKPKH